MATIADAQRGIAREHRFFLTMAIAMAAVIVGGFSANLLLGRSSFALPLIYHVHAFVFFGWVALYVMQNALIAGGAVHIHRRLGWLALVWAPAMIVLGIAVTLHAVRNHGGPPFFDLNEFLIGNIMGLLGFAGLVTAAIMLRRRTDWHRRLMFCGMAILTGPGFGRLLPTPLFIPWAWSIVALVAPLIFPLIGMAFDRRRTGHVHRAWWWGAGAMIAAHVAGELIAYSPPGRALTEAVVAGTPGADRDWRAHFPSAAP
jgi:hypothetical protein